MKLRNKLIIGGVILVLVVLSLIGTQILGIPSGKRFTIDESFDIPSPAIHSDSSRLSSLITEEMRPYCSSSSDGKVATCEDDRFKVKRGTNANVIIDKGVLRIAGQPQQLANSDAIVTYKINLKNRDIEVAGNIIQGGAMIFNHQISQLGRFRIQAIIDDENEDLYHIIYAGEEVGIMDTVRTIDKFGIQKFNVEFTGSGGKYDIEIDTISSQPYLNCRISPDDVVFKAKFYAGSKIRVRPLESDSADTIGLPRNITKICPEGRPVVKKSLFTGAERAEVFDTTFNKLISNQLVEVPEDQVMEINYAVDFKQGMNDSNCPTGGYFLKGEGCKQVNFEQEDLVQRLFIHNLIPITEQQVTFINQINIGDKNIFSSISYMCEDSKANFPRPSESCWKVMVGYDGEQSEMSFGEEIKLDEFFNLRLLDISAQYKDGRIQEGFQNIFILTLKNPDILKFNNIRDERYYILINSPAEKYCFALINNYGNFSDSGIVLKKTTVIDDIETSEFRTIPFPRGTSKQCIDIDSSKFGEIEYNFIGYFTVGEKKLFDNEITGRNFEIAGQIPTHKPPEVNLSITLPDVPPYIEPPIIQSFWMKIKDFFSKIIGWFR